MTDLSKLSDDELQKLYGGVSGMSDADLQAAYKATQPVAKGSLLPLSRDAAGNVSFDSNAGIVGALKRAFTLPGEVMSGQTQMPPLGLRREDLTDIPPDTSPDPSSPLGRMGISVPRVAAQPGDQIIGRALETATMGTPVNPAIRAGDAIIPGVSRALVQKKPVVPTTKELYDAGVKDLTAAADSGLEIAAPAVVDWSRKVQQSLYDNGGITEVNAPQTFALLKKFEDAPAGAVASAKNLKSIREALGGVAQNFNPQAARDQLAATRAIKALDEFIPAVDEASVLAGSPAATAKLLETGRGNYAAAQRSNDITGNLDRATTGILERAEGRAQAANSGRNIDNTIRQKTAAILEKPKEISGLNEAEIAALESVRDGGAGRNTARYIGNLLGGGGGMGQSLWAMLGGAGGAAAGGPIGAAVGVAAPTIGGAGAKSIANFLARKDLKGVDELLRKRSPLYQERASNPEKYVISPEKRAALVRMLLMQQAAGQ